MVINDNFIAVMNYSVHLTGIDQTAQSRLHAWWALGNLSVDEVRFCYEVVTFILLIHRASAHHEKLLQNAI